MTEWVALIPIYDVCDREMGYSGGGRRRDPWWWKTAARKQLKDMLEEIFTAARERQRKYGRHGEDQGQEELAESESGSEGSWYAETETGYERVGG